MDLARWDFGEILAKRAGLEGLEPRLLTLEVRAYRLAILRSCFPSSRFSEQGFVLGLASLRALTPPQAGLPCESCGRGASPDYFMERRLPGCPWARLRAALAALCPG